jgi:8-oxo-dGTP pyrophosphatase MutT (NUDIX family)
MTLAERLRRAISAAPTVEMIPSDGPLADGEAALKQPAAVLIAITDASEPGVILTRRPDTMRRHAGQVSFPGGRVDPDDQDVVAAALREAEEEIGLPRHVPEVIGTVDLYQTISHYTITPVLAVIPDGLSFSANPHEVAHIFEAPLSFLLDPANHESFSINWQGQQRQVIEMHWQDQRIWGATAAMIVNLSRRLAWHG